MNNELMLEMTLGMAEEEKEKYFTYFNGDEEESVFLKKCLEQWEKVKYNVKYDMEKLMILEVLFKEIKCRVNRKIIKND